MRTNRELALAVRRALATGTIALCGVGSVAAFAQQAATPQTAPAAVTSAKTATAKTATANKPILLAQAAQQTTPQPPTAPAPVLQTVVVTGTMIARPAAETAEAVTVVSTAALKDQGIVNVEQAIDQISANVPSAINIAQSVGEFTGGGTYANLRDLGDGRTLVLLDGQRLADNADNGDAVDLSGIPFSAIDSVQVLREGASSLYGSDAIAGVINFITKKNYQGGEVEVDYDRPQEAGGASGDADFTFGHGDLVSDGYNFMITGSYSLQKELLATQRSFSATGLAPNLGLFNTNGIGTWPATVVDGNGNIWSSDYPACTGNTFVTRADGDCQYEYSAATDIIPKHDEASGMASFTKELPANNTLAVQYFYTRSTVTQWGGPMFYLFTMTPQADPTYFPTASELSCDPYYGSCSAPPDLTDPITAIWTDPNNNRFSDDINTEQRALVTFSGNNAGWDYSTSLNYSQNGNTQGDTGGYPNEALWAPNGVLTNLVNPFGAQSAAGQQFIDDSYVNGVYANGKMKRWSVDGHASHPLGDAFHAGTPATVAIGASVEGDSFNFATTPLDNILYAATAFAPTAIHGSRTAQAVFIELDVPMSKSLDADISDREDRYSDFGTTNNGKVALRFQPSRYVTFRGTASTGFRAPTLYDLYQPDSIGATGGSVGEVNPICLSGDYNTEFSKTVCENQGLALYGGNTHLTPETSENFDIGVIVEPLRNLGITLDYYRILLKNAIGGIPSNAIYGNPTEFASDYVLNSAGTLSDSLELSSQCIPYTSGNCGYILQNTQNTGGITTDGIDVSVKYSKDTPVGLFHVDLEGTAITQYRLQEYTGGPVLNLVGWYNSGNEPAIRWQHTLNIDWTSPNAMWGGGVSNRFFSSYIDQNPVPLGGTGQRIVGCDSNWDVYASYKPVHPLTVLFGIRDVLNKNPPFSNQTGNWPTGYNPIYSSPLLRTFYVNLKYTFL